MAIVRQRNGDSTYAPERASDLLGSNTFAYVEFEVPIVGWSF